MSPFFLFWGWPYCVYGRGSDKSLLLIPHQMGKGKMGTISFGCIPPEQEKYKMGTVSLGLRYFIEISCSPPMGMLYQSNPCDCLQL